MKLLKAWLGTLQPIEDTVMSIMSQRQVGQAVGAQLDLLGKLVGQGRGGLSDEDYRRYISTRIAANKSNGLTDELIRIATLVLNDDSAGIVVTQEGTATIRMRVSDVAITGDLAAILFKFENLAKAAGVRIVVQWSESIPADTFTLDAGPGLDTGHLSGSLG